MKRYVAVQRMPWGLVHIQAGEALVNPDPEQPAQRALIELLLKQGAIRIEEMPEPRKNDRKASQTYKRRDLTAEESPARDSDDAERRTSRRFGAMTTEDQPGITKSDE